MDLPESFANFEEWRFHSIRLYAGHLEIVLQHELDEGIKVDYFTMLRFPSPNSFGWLTTVFMNKYTNGPHPVLRQIENGDRPACVSGFQVFEDFVDQNWERYELDADDEVIQVLTLEPPTIEICEASEANWARFHLPTLMRKSSE